MLSFACLTNELKDYWAKPLKQKSDQKLLKSKEWRRKESSIKLNRIYSLTIDTYITTEKKSKTGKRVYFSKVSGKCWWYKLIFTVKNHRKTTLRVDLSKFKYILFIFPFVFLQLSQYFPKRHFWQFHKTRTSLSSSTSSADLGSHNSHLTESFSTP